MRAAIAYIIFIFHDLFLFFSFAGPHGHARAAAGNMTGPSTAALAPGKLGNFFSVLFLVAVKKINTHTHICYV